MTLTETQSDEVRFFRVGGCVRDGFLGIKTKDIDFAVEAPSFEAMAEAVEARCTRVFVDTDGNYIGQQFFTIRGIEPELGAVDFVLCRKDGPSSDGRRPDFVEPGTILDDLARRDFTVNAMALTDDGTLLDPHGGMVDLEARRLRFVGTPEDRLREDTLRAFRALRFAVTKSFSMSEDTILALKALQPESFDAATVPDHARDCV
jgi:tRNA nucleotidyltransferase/poly(A) polymerase